MGGGYPTIHGGHFPIPGGPVACVLATIFLSPLPLPLSPLLPQEEGGQNRRRKGGLWPGFLAF